MEFTPRGGASQPLNAANASGRGGRRKHIDWATKTVRLELFILLIGTALLLVAVSLYLGFSNSNAKSEFDRVANNKYQAIFLNGGVTSGSVLYSTYFGHITKMNDKYVVLQNVYYLTTDQATQNSQASPQLTKLGCQQLHSPYDEMVINRNQVAFWENLKNDGKVVQAINQYIKQNPNGPNCTAQSNTQNSAGSTQNTTTPSTNKTTP
jgi:hypothetical protein